MIDKIRVTPNICSYVDEQHTVLTVEIDLPGVPKANIVLKVHEDSMNLSAPREDIEYATTLAFCCPVKPESARAKFEDGLLRITVPFAEPLENAFTVAIE